MRVQHVQSVLNGPLHAKEKPEEEEPLAGTASSFTLDPKGGHGSLPWVCAQAVLHPPSPKAQPTVVLRTIQGWKMDTSACAAGSSICSDWGSVFPFLLVPSWSGMSGSCLGSPGVPSWDVLFVIYSWGTAQPEPDLAVPSPLSLLHIALLVCSPVWMLMILSGRRFYDLEILISG